MAGRREGSKRVDETRSIGASGTMPVRAESVLVRGRGLTLRRGDLRSDKRGGGGLTSWPWISFALVDARYDGTSAVERRLLRRGGDAE